MNALMARLALSVIDRFNFYFDLGAVSDMSYSYVLQGEKYTVDFEDNETIWGIGGNALIYRWNNGLEVGTGISYRQVDMKIEKATIDSTEYTYADMTTPIDGDMEEVQVAAELAWRNEYFTPYVGIKYSDIEVDSTFTVGSVERDASGKKSDGNIGAFIGLSITPKIDALGDNTDRLAINLEGRFVDEEAMSVGVSYKF